MGATPKKKHSTKRTGTRRSTKLQKLPEVVYDKITGNPRLSHRTATR